MLQADIFAAKAERYLRDGHQEAAARECVRGLGEVKDDDRLQQMFHKAVRRIATSVPATEDCAAEIDIIFLRKDAIIGEPLPISIQMEYIFDPGRIPTDSWLGLYTLPNTLRKLLHDDKQELTDTGLCV